MSWLLDYDQLPLSFKLREQHQSDKLLAAINNVHLSGNSHKGVRTAVSNLLGQLDADGTIEVVYSREDYGRYYADGPCSTKLKRAIRADSLPDYYVDVDAVNCFPSLIKHLCQLHKIDKKEWSLLDKFVENRECIYRSLKITSATLAKYNAKRRESGSVDDRTKRELAKHIMNMAFYGAGRAAYEELGIDYPFGETSTASQLVDQIKGIAKSICSFTAYKKVVDYSKKKSDSNGKSYHVFCAFSNILQSMECLYLHRLRELLERTKPGCVCIYEYDGLIFDSRLLSVDEFERVNDSIADWPLKFTIKERCVPLSQMAQPDIDDEDVEVSDEYIMSASKVSKELVTLVKKANLLPVSTPIALILVELYGGGVRTTGKGTWFKFDLHRWTKLEIPPTNDIDTMIMPLLDRLESVGMKVRELRVALLDIRLKTRVMTDLFNKIHDSSLESKLDGNPDLLGFNNGVYDLSTGQFRAGKPDDYVVMSTGYDYEPAMGESAQLVKFLEQVFPIKEYRDYFLRTSASFLEGRNRAQAFSVWPGSGGNGKSKTMELCSLALGQYCMSMSSDIMVGKGVSGGESASPQMSLAIKKRLVHFSEIKAGSRLNDQLVKQLTGGDELTVRALYGNPFTFKPGFDLVGLLQPSAIRFDSSDGGMSRRIRPMPFVSRFVKPGEGTNAAAYVFTRDANLKIESLKLPFINLLLDEYRRWREGGFAEVSPPEAIAKYTNALMADNAPAVFSFIEECVTSDANGFLTLSDAYTAFCAYNDGPKIQRGAFKSSLNSSLVQESKKNNVIGWRGYRLSLPTASE